jgi:hypothetical protein
MGGARGGGSKWCSVHSAGTCVAPDTTVTPDRDKIAQTSTRIISTTMAPIDDALAAIEAQGPEEKLVYQRIADQYGVDRSTLARRHKRVQVSQEVKHSSQQKLTPQQEAELVKYIEELTVPWIPPTREMIRNFASAVAKEPVSESWVTRFINKYTIDLISL